MNSNKWYMTINNNKSSIIIHYSARIFKLSCRPKQGRFDTYEHLHTSMFTTNFDLFDYLRSLRTALWYCGGVEAQLWLSCLGSVTLSYLAIVWSGCRSLILRLDFFLLGYSGWWWMMRDEYYLILSITYNNILYFIT